MTTSGINLTVWLEKVNDACVFPEKTVRDAGFRDSLGNSLLHVAAIWNDADAISLLYHLGLDLNSQGEHMYTPMHEAVEQCSYSALQKLLDLGANRAIKNEIGLTPLELAQVNDNDEAIALLTNGNPEGVRVSR